MPFHLALSVTVHDGPSPVLLVSGLPGHEGHEVPFLIDTASGVVRTLWRVRGIPARLPERPIGPGLPSLASVLRSTVLEGSPP